MQRVVVVDTSRLRVPYGSCSCSVYFVSSVTIWVYLKICI
jgi:hypothetical protein